MECIGAVERRAGHAPSVGRDLVSVGLLLLLPCLLAALPATDWAAEAAPGASIGREQQPIAAAGASVSLRVHFDSFLDPVALRGAEALLLPRLLNHTDTFLSSACAVECVVAQRDGDGDDVGWYHDFLVVTAMLSACSFALPLDGEGVPPHQLTLLVDHLGHRLDGTRLCAGHVAARTEGVGVWCVGVTRVVADASIAASIGGRSDVPADDSDRAGRADDDDCYNSNTTKRRLRQRRLLQEVDEADANGGDDDHSHPARAARRVYPADAYRVEALWDLYPDAMGQNARLGLFDTGVSVNNPHLKHAQIASCMSFTNERGGAQSSRWCADGHGHGTFGASLMVGGGGGDGSGGGGCRDSTPAASPSRRQQRNRDDGVGMAPKAALHVFKVFTDQQMSLTSWFLAAFNVALQLQLDVINLSFGSMDYYDEAFLEKLRDVAAAGIVVVTASGNDGPRQGSVFNPADQPEVLAVGSVDGPVPRRVSPFSSRGMTTWELPFGMGRPRPDVVSFGEDVVGGSSQRARRTCRVLTGTSVASPVVAGVLGMLVSFIKGALLEDAERRSRVAGGGATAPVVPRATNVAMLKQIVMETAQPLCPPPRRAAPIATLRDYSLFTQGAGLVDPYRALAWTARQLSSEGGGVASLLRLTAYPSKILAHWTDQTLRAVRDTVDCASTMPHVWPWVLRAKGGGVFLTSSPMVVNLTLYNSAASTAHLASVDVVYDNATAASGDSTRRGVGRMVLSSAAAKRLLTVAVDASETMRAHVGFAGVFFFTTVPLPVGMRYATVYGSVRLQYRSSRGPGGASAGAGSLLRHVTVPFAIDVTPPPPRRRRLLWDATAQLLYPGAFIPRDNIRQQGSLDFAEWGGDHPLTNHVPLYEFLVIELGYVVDLVHHPRMVRTTPSQGGASAPTATTTTPSPSIPSVLSLYRVLLIVDPEDYMDGGYLDGIEAAVKHHDLQLVLLSDWAHEGVMLQASFTDPATQLLWEPSTSGVTVAAVNALMRRFGVLQSDHCVVSGYVATGGESATDGQGTAAAAAPGLVVPLTSAGCLYSVANDGNAAGSENRTAASSPPEVWACFAGDGGVQTLHDDALELKQLAIWNQQQQQGRGVAPVGSKRRRQRPPAAAMVPAAASPPLFTFVRYARGPAAAAGGAQAPAALRSAKRRISIVEDHINEAQGGGGAATTSRSGTATALGGGGGVFFFPDSDCVDAMHHYSSSGLPSHDHTYCFGLIASALKVLSGDETLDRGMADGAVDAPQLSPLSSVCSSVPTGSRVLQTGDGAAPPNRTWEDVSLMPPSSHRRDRLYLVSRRYRTLAEQDGACDRKVDQQQQAAAGRPILRCARQRWAIEDRVGDVLEEWMAHLQLHLPAEGSAEVVAPSAELQPPPRATEVGHHPWTSLKRGGEVLPVVLLTAIAAVVSLCMLWRHHRRTMRGRHRARQHRLQQGGRYLGHLGQQRSGGVAAGVVDATGNMALPPSGSLYV